MSIRNTLASIVQHQLISEFPPVQSPIISCILFSSFPTHARASCAVLFFATQFHVLDCRRLREEPQIGAKSLCNRPKEPLLASVFARRRTFEWRARPDSASLAQSFGCVRAPVDEAQPRVSRRALPAHEPLACCRWRCSHFCSGSGGR